MKSKSNIVTSLKATVIASAILISCLTLQAAPETQKKATQQKNFSTAKEAADALVQAAETFDVPALKEILGPDSDDIVSSQDPVEDKNRAAAFVAKAKEKSSIETDPKNSNRAILTVGNDDFPVPIPIIKNKGKWMFDTKAGREEILDRRIGGNELDAIAICRGFVDAQHEYAEQKHDDSRVNQYAQRIISTPGKHGYYFKVLKSQGPNAPLGQMDFVVNGTMIGGFALAAAPAQYRVTGVKSFLVGPDGVVYEKDLGPDTLKLFEKVERYNPDKTWRPTTDEWPSDATE
jgi:hypothetical protein